MELSYENSERFRKEKFSIIYILQGPKYYCVKKCPYSGFFWSVFYCIRVTRSISPYSFQMRENKDQKNPEYGHFSGIAHLSKCFFFNFHIV